MGAPVERLKRRREFLNVAASRRRFVTPGMIVQFLPQDSIRPRVGFTVTKRVGNAVVRNLSNMPLAEMLEKEVAARQLDIADTRRAASQFFALLKGEHHARMLFGCGQPTAEEAEAHLTAAVDMFLRAYSCDRR